MIVNCKSANYTFFEKNEISKMYFADIRKYKMLSNEDEIELIKQSQQTVDADLREKAINKLVCANQLFVVSVAKKVAKTANFTDLINEGNIGLMEAIQRFDVTKKSQFLTYAVFWIRKRINNYIFDKGIMVHPHNFPKIRQYTTAIQRDFFAENQRYADNEELRDLMMERYKFNVPDLGDLNCVPHISIDEPIASSEETTFESFSPFNMATATNNVETETEHNHNTKYLEALISTLDERNQRLVKSFFGVCGFEERPINLLADEYGISKERVARIIETSIEKLKTASKDTTMRMQYQQ